MRKDLESGTYHFRTITLPLCTYFNMIRTARSTVTCLRADLLFDTLEDFYLLQRAQTSFENHPTSYKMGNGGFSLRDKAPGDVKLTCRFHLVANLRKSRVIPPPHTPSCRARGQLYFPNYYTVSLGFFIDIILPATLRSWGRLSL
jgi:hypothetical protein